MPLRSRARAALTLGAALLACDDPVRPAAPRARTYALARADGRPPAATVDTSGLGFAVVLADTLIFEPAGRVTRALTLRLVTSSLGTDRTSHHRSAFEYRQRGRQVEVGSFRPCPPNALCAPNDTGVVSPDGRVILMRTHWYGRRPRLEFVVVPE